MTEFIEKGTFLLRNGTAQWGHDLRLCEGINGRADRGAQVEALTAASAARESDP
jgi:hypothetical protein